MAICAQVYFEMWKWNQWIIAHYETICRTNNAQLLGGQCEMVNSLLQATWVYLNHCLKHVGLKAAKLETHLGTIREWETEEFVTS